MAERMLSDRRAKAKVREFLLTWLKADASRDLTKDVQTFPGFDVAVISDLRTSLELFLDDVVSSEGSDFRQLLLSEDLYLNGRLGPFYGAQLPAEADFTKVRLLESRRAGVLTHPYLLASFAYTRETSPIHRGVFLVRGMLGQTLRPPPEAVVPLPVELHPRLTTRERVILQTQATTCMSCHGIINPLGFTLENFDAIGRYREKDRDQTVDATGSYHTRAGAVIRVNGARELAEFLAGNTESQAAFIDQLFHHLVQQSVRAYGPTTLDELQRTFVVETFHIRKLVVAVMVASALRGRENNVVRK